VWIWAFSAFGNGGFGGGNNASVQGALTRADLCQDMNFSQLQNSVRGLEQGLCDGFYAMNTNNLNAINSTDRNLCQGFSAVNSAIAENRYSAQNCCYDSLAA
jgi:hypothetical protein